MPGDFRRAACAFLLVAVGGVGQSLVRGPYLQLGTPTSVVLRWRTDVPTDSVVSYGTTIALGATVSDGTAVIDHVVTLSGLAPDTTYYYAVGSTAGVLASGPDHFFLTAPPPGTPKPTRVWVIGDCGVGSLEARAVRDAYTNFTGMRHTDLWLMLGDNAYVNGTDAEFQAGVFQNKYEALLRKSVLWPAYGNHDGYSANALTQTGPYFDIFTLPTAGEAGGVPSGSEAYYSYDYANVHFICLDSYQSSNVPGSPMMTWLAADLAATSQRWRVAYWHHPPYSKGTHDSDTESWMVAMRQNVLPTLEAGGVDLVLCGHSHAYERSRLIDGHYGDSTTFGPQHLVDGGDGKIGSNGPYRKPMPSPSPHAGAVYVVAGTGAFVVGGLPLNHPALPTAFSALGSLVMDIDGDQIDLRFIDVFGLVLDRFSLVKGPATAVDRRHVLMLPGASFRYDDTGVDLGQAWSAPTFNDTGWPPGPAPLGYGEPFVATTVSFGPDPANKWPTAYFRTTFTLPFDPAYVASARLWLNYDDGVVAWLNGQEIVRTPGLPAGQVPFGAFAPAHEAGSFAVFPVAPSAFATGTNLLALEVHQTNAASTDLVIDAALDCDAFVPLLQPSASGNADPSGVLFLNGSTGGAARGIDLPASAGLTLSVVPPQGAVAPDFALFGVVGTPGASDVYALPYGIGPMCFAPSVLAPAPNLFLLTSSFAPGSGLVPGSQAPWSVTFPGGAPVGFVATLQGVILDASSTFRVTNAVRLAVVP